MRVRSTRFALKRANRARRIGVTRSAPLAEFADVDAAIAGLAVVHPGLWTFQNRPNPPLSEIGFLANPTQKSRDAFVRLAMLRLRSHRKAIVTAITFDRSSLSGNNCLDKCQY